MRKHQFLAVALGAMAVVGAPAIAQQQAAHPEAHGSTSEEALNMRPYPAAEKGQTRHVIRLPQLADENQAKVEIIVGRTMDVDCNQHRFGGQIEERTAEGWGYNYYVLKDLGQAASTLMGCIKSDHHSAFVTSPNQPLIRYNSKLPVVVYAPSDVEVRYRIWRAGEEEILG